MSAADLHPLYQGQTIPGALGTSLTLQRTGRHPVVDSYLARLGVPNSLHRDDALAFALQAAEERQRLYDSGGLAALKIRLCKAFNRSSTDAVSSVTITLLAVLLV